MIYIYEIPNDILYEFCKYLDIKDWCKLSSSNRELHKKILNIQEYLLSFELHRFRNNKLIISQEDSNMYLYMNFNHAYNYTHYNHNNHNTIINIDSKEYNRFRNITYKTSYLKDLFYNFIKYHLNEHIKRFVEYKNNDFRWNPHYIKNYNLQKYILYFSHIHPIPVGFEFLTGNYIVNNIFNRVLHFYTLNNFTNLEKYQNKYELFVLYVFLHIDLYQYTQNVPYMLHFLEIDNDIIRDRFYDIKMIYYRHVLNGIHLNTISSRIDVKRMSYICKYISNLSILMRIMTLVPLDLQYTEFDIGCEQCNIMDLFEICFIKMTNQEDPIVSKNYRSIKDLLRRKNHFYYKMIVDRETYLINSYIYVKNPKTNKRISINGNTYRRMMKQIYHCTSIYSEHNNENNKVCKSYNSIIKYVTNRQIYLRKKIFS